VTVPGFVYSQVSVFVVWIYSSACFSSYQCHYFVYILFKICFTTAFIHLLQFNSDFMNLCLYDYMHLLMYAFLHVYV
jgi:hypothetical protein